MSQPKLRVAIYPFEPRLDIHAQMLLAIEEIGHAGDINDQPGGAVLRGMRPTAAGPPAHLFKRRPLAHRIGVAHGKHWAKAAVAPFQLMSKSAIVLALFSPRLCRCLAKPAAPGSGYRSSGVSAAWPPLPFWISIRKPAWPASDAGRENCGKVRSGSIPPAECTACLPPPGSRAFPRRSRDGSCAKPFVSCGDACACATRLRPPP